MSTLILVFHPHLKDGSRVKIKDEYLYVQNRILMPFMEEPRQRD